MNYLLSKIFNTALFVFLFCASPLIAGEIKSENTIKGRLFENNLCLAVKFEQGESLNDLGMIKALGVKWVREGLSWPLVEQRKGVYGDFPKSLMTQIDFYKSNNIGLILVITNENTNAYPNTAEYPNDFANPIAYGRFVGFVARKLKQHGVNFIIELWNEPHNSAFAKKEHLGGNWQGAPPSPWVDHYLSMVAEAVKRVKALDATVHVIVNEDVWVAHYHFLEKGLPKEIDGFAIHPYTFGQPPEITAMRFDTEWTKPYQVVDEDQSFESAVRRLREQGIKKLGKVPTISITEWGWAVGEKSANGLLSESKVAMYLPRAFILAESAGVKNTCWFSSQDIGDGPFGLKTNDGRLRPAYDAYLKLYQTLGKTSFECELKQADGSKTKRAFAFRKEQENQTLPSWVIASWDTQPKSFYDEAVTYTQMKASEYSPVCKNINSISIK